mgnify:CR=1 FL=1
MIALGIVALVCMVTTPQVITRLEGMGLIIIFGLVYLRSIQINNGAAEPLPETTTSNPLPSSIVRLGGGLFGIVCGGKFVIDSSLNIASQMGLSEAFIALFGIALGTSLPELITGIVALKEKKADLIIGNVIGSNIFNTLLVIGTSSIIFPIQFNPILFSDLAICLLLSLMVSIFIRNSTHSLYQWSSGLLLIGYISYTTFIFIRG